MNLCYKCKKRPAVVFVSEMNPTSSEQSEPRGLCLVCAKEAGIKPINDMLEKMNISDEDIEQMSDQFMDLMSLSENSDEDDQENEFLTGGAATFPFLNNVFGTLPGSGDAKTNEKSEKQDEKKDASDKKNKQKRRKFIEQYCTNLTYKAKM
ncbi:MAG: ATP-dependent Clp protease ATP-binding subunit, partial [Oscillospiraceae bacterium]